VRGGRSELSLALGDGRKTAESNLTVRVGVEGWPVLSLIGSLLHVNKTAPLSNPYQVSRGRLLSGGNVYGTSRDATTA
jgi:hypothetical protein